jgi:hypothetical protein
MILKSYYFDEDFTDELFYCKMVKYSKSEFLFRGQTRTAGNSDLRESRHELAVRNIRIQKSGFL